MLARLEKVARGRRTTGGIILKFRCDARVSGSVICNASSCDDPAPTARRGAPGSSPVQIRDTPPDTTSAMTLALSASIGCTRSRGTTTRQPSQV
jgi:hypothetical protein